MTEQNNVKYNNLSLSITATLTVYYTNVVNKDVKITLISALRCEEIYI